MTRVLSELLGAPEPMFQLSLAQLEKSAGRPSHDIRLSTEIQLGVKSKLHELGLDPHDTDGRELYMALGERLKVDEQRFARALQANSKKTDDPIAHVAVALTREVASGTVLALKSTVAKRILKANVPKKAMKALGYRSADSMLKHESAASIFAAAALIENEQWTTKLLGAYAKLKASDFENRKLSIEHPTSKRWHELAETVVAERAHNIFGFKELGTVVLLPLPAVRPELITLTTAALTIHAINEIQAASTFLKLHQMQPNFGAVVKQVVVGEPVLPSKLLDKPVSWNIVQNYYSRLAESVRAELFEPVVHAEDFAWQAVEHVLARIEPALGFWRGTHYLAMAHPKLPVSYNLTDLLLSHCNALPFESRHVQYFRHALTTELTLRYMNYEQLQQTVSQQFQQQLTTATEPVLV